MTDGIRNPAVGMEMIKGARREARGVTTALSSAEIETLRERLARAEGERDILVDYAVRKFGYTGKSGWTKAEATEQIRGDLGLDAAPAGGSEGTR